MSVFKQVLSFHGVLIVLITMSVRFIYIVVCQNFFHFSRLILPIYGWRDCGRPLTSRLTHTCMHMKENKYKVFLFSHSSISRHLCCFCLWDAVNYTSVNGDYKCLPQSSLLILLGSYPEVGFLNHKLILCWTFLKIHLIVYQPAFILKGGEALLLISDRNLSWLRPKSIQVLALY